MIIYHNETLSKILEENDIIVIRRVCEQTLGLGLEDRNRTVVIISLQWRKSM